MNLPLHHTQAPLASVASASDATQVAALCWRMRAGQMQVLLVTSRGTGRWIVPKGWQIDGQGGAASALIEAWEEAGVRGSVESQPLGIYSYVKLMDDGTGRPVLATLYAVHVRALMKAWPEMGERRRKWMSPRKAAARVAEPELAALLLNFARAQRST
jgi:8-oxo-dGTP pyrophosphatase MutT (NUDIX family)